MRSTAVSAYHLAVPWNLLLKNTSGQQQVRKHTALLHTPHCSTADDTHHHKLLHCRYRAAHFTYLNVCAVLYPATHLFQCRWSHHMCSQLSVTLRGPPPTCSKAHNTYTDAACQPHHKLTPATAMPTLLSIASSNIVVCTLVHAIAEQLRQTPATARTMWCALVPDCNTAVAAAAAVLLLLLLLLLQCCCCCCCCASPAMCVAAAPSVHPCAVQPHSHSWQCSQGCGSTTESQQRNTISSLHAVQDMTDGETPVAAVKSNATSSRDAWLNW
jgi:hypothetical protein